MAKQTFLVKVPPFLTPSDEKLYSSPNPPDETGWMGRSNSNDFVYNYNDISLVFVDGQAYIQISVDFEDKVAIQKIPPSQQAGLSGFFGAGQLALYASYGLTTYDSTLRPPRYRRNYVGWNMTNPLIVFAYTLQDMTASIFPTQRDREGKLRYNFTYYPDNFNPIPKDGGYVLQFRNNDEDWKRIDEYQPFQVDLYQGENLIQMRAYDAVSGFYDGSWFRIIVDSPRARALVRQDGSLLVRDNKHILWGHKGLARVWSGDPKTGNVEASDNEGATYQLMANAWTGVSGAKPLDFEALPQGGACSLAKVGTNIQFTASWDGITWQTPVTVCAAGSSSAWCVRTQAPGGAATLTVTDMNGVRYDSDQLGAAGSWVVVT